MAFAIFERWSPEYALNNVFADVNTSGLDGLKKHLTSNALKVINGIETVSGLTEVSLISTALLGDNAVNILLDKLSECDWTIRDVMKGNETSKAVIGFEYQDVMAGTIELTMIKETDIWKIDRLDIPKFEKLKLPQMNTDQQAE